MKKLFQTEWHSIPFSSFAELRSDRLVDTNFYKEFYRHFFDKYSSLSDLDPEWLALKLKTINQLIDLVPISKSSRILSIGCGVGIMEMELIKKGYHHIEVTEVSSDPLNWIKAELPFNSIHVGSFPDIIPRDKRFDWILMSIIDYHFDEKSFPLFLSTASGYLDQGGICSLICNPYEEKLSVLEKLKYFLRDRYPQLERFGLLKPAQLWGYVRTLKEYREAIKQAGLVIIKEGIIDTRTRWKSYQLTFQR